MYYLNCFLVYSILGYIMEMLFGIMIGAHAESGILYGPWTVIYGFGSVLIILISDKLFKSLHLSRWIETIIVFFIVAFVLTILEWFGGIIIESVFGFSFWDYSSYKYNFGKYICLEMAFVWGVLSIIFIYVLRPILDKYILRIPKWVTILCLILFCFDFIVRLLVEFGVF